MKAVEKLKQNPLLATAIIIGSLAGAGTATWAAVGLVDTLHTTEAELLIYDLKAHTFASNQFTGLEMQLNEQAVVSKCRWLSSEIRSLKDSIYVRKRDGADPDYIHSLEGDLEDLEADYDALLCALKLAQGVPRHHAASSKSGTSIMPQSRQRYTLMTSAQSSSANGVGS